MARGEFTKEKARETAKAAYQQTLRSLQDKLRPGRFTAMSHKMAAIVGCILSEEWTRPRLAELVQTSDGFVLGRIAGDCGCNEFIGVARAM